MKVLYIKNNLGKSDLCLVLNKHQKDKYLFINQFTSYHIGLQNNYEELLENLNRSKRYYIEISSKPFKLFMYLNILYGKK